MTEGKSYLEEQRRLQRNPTTEEVEAQRQAYVQDRQAQDFLYGENVVGYTKMPSHKDETYVVQTGNGSVSPQQYLDALEAQGDVKKVAVGKNSFDSGLGKAAGVGTNATIYQDKEGKTVAVRYDMVHGAYEFGEKSKIEDREALAIDKNFLQQRGDVFGKTEKPFLRAPRFKPLDQRPTLLPGHQPSR